MARLIRADSLDLNYGYWVQRVTGSVEASLLIKGALGFYSMKKQRICGKFPELGQMRQIELAAVLVHSHSMLWRDNFL
jgi:hypothetical protein